MTISYVISGMKEVEENFVAREYGTLTLKIAEHWLIYKLTCILFICCACH